PLRVAELHAELARKDPSLNPAIQAAPDFGRPDHVLFARCPGFDRRRAAEIFLARARNDAEFPWSGELVQLIGELPAEQSLPLLGQLWNKGGLEEEILPLLARAPDPADRDKFLRGLGAPQLAIISLSLGALEKLPPDNDATHTLAVLRCLRCLPEGKEADRLRERLGRYLQRLTAQNFGTSKQAWTEWFAKTYPELA